MLAALRSAILCEAPYGPFGGLPAGIRVDRGKDFLSRTAGQSLAHFGVMVGDLPGYSLWLKGTVEELSGAVEEMVLRSLPRHLHQPTLRGGRPVDPGAPAVRFEFFVGLLLDWVSDWNTRIPKRGLAGRTPLREHEPRKILGVTQAQHGRRTWTDTSYHTTSPPKAGQSHCCSTGPIVATFPAVPASNEPCTC
ncbi:hypothetical protein AB0C33_14940 [Nonomuraea sp. NPDC048881]|uniref:hypothetical protein n=1 Tax=Nonomuraea sp. NPDC048881 TaxID=3155030 RepID=UPI0033E5DE90